MPINAWPLTSSYKVHRVSPPKIALLLMSVIGKQLTFASKQHTPNAVIEDRNVNCK